MFGYAFNKSVSDTTDVLPYKDITFQMSSNEFYKTKDVGLLGPGIVTIYVKPCKS